MKSKLRKSGLTAVLFSLALCLQAAPVDKRPDAPITVVFRKQFWDSSRYKVEVQNKGRGPLECSMVVFVSTCDNIDPDNRYEGQFTVPATGSYKWDDDDKPPVFRPRVFGFIHTKDYTPKFFGIDCTEGEVHALIKKWADSPEARKKQNDKYKEAFKGKLRGLLGLD